MTSVELGADPVGARANPGVQHAWAVATRAWMGRAVAAPGASYAWAAAAAALVAAVAALESERDVWPAVVVVVVVGTLVVDLVTTPGYERDRTARPVQRLLVTGGAALLGASAFAGVDPAEVRWGAAVVLSAAATLAGADAMARGTRLPRAVLLVGGRVGVGQLAAQWATCPDVEVVGVCLPEPTDELDPRLGPLPVLGSLDDVAAVARTRVVDQVVLVPGPLLSAHEVRRLIWALEELPVELSVVAEIDGVVPRRVTPHELGRRLILSVRPGRPSPIASCVKGLVDRLAAALLLVVLSPLLLMAAIVIRFDTPGPAVFRQTRVGLDGRPFTIFKLRTMQVDAEARLAALMAVNEGAGPLFKMAADPRTTRVGRTLRRTSIDELPQLVNVLRGEMSLIGPRPGLPAETMTYDDWVGRRLRVKPGLTGAWQVGGRSNLSWTDSVRLDIDYVDNATLRDDVRIVVKTARVVIGRDGAV